MRSLINNWANTIAIVSSRFFPYSDISNSNFIFFNRGKFAQVRRITHKKTGVVFAAKSIKRRRPRFGDVTSEIFHEIRVLLLTIPCNRIVHLHEVFETRTEFILVLELYVNTTRAYSLIQFNLDLLSTERQAVNCSKFLTITSALRSRFVVV